MAQPDIWTPPWWARGPVGLAWHRRRARNATLSALRLNAQLGPGFQDEFLRARAREDYQAAFAQSSPLVTICIGTYNRADLLLHRSLPSALGQDYKNIEVVVVGDGCSDDTFERLAGVHDSRLRCTNLPQRGPYPPDERFLYAVAGIASVNHALTMARGSFITHLDDDDEHPATRVSKLVNFIQEQRADLVWHPFDFQDQRGRWRRNNAKCMAWGQVTTSSVLYHAWLGKLPWDPQVFRYLQPADWDRFEKMWYLGAKCARYPETLLKHYRERTRSS